VVLDPLVGHCVIQTLAVKMPNAILDLIDLAKLDQFVLARKLHIYSTSLFLCVLSCRRGYSGNALVACRRGECFNDSECPDHLACFDYKCKDPCKGPDTSCGVNAQCKVVNHGAICSCPQGYQGDPVNGCFRSRRG